MHDRHPILRHRAFVIPSPPLLEFAAALKRKLRGGELSLCLYGPPRVGKTSALQYVLHNLQSTKKGVVRKAAFEKQQYTRRVDRAEFWRRFLGEAAATPASWRSPAGARTALLNGIMVDSDTLQTDTVLIVVDEAQNLVVHHLSMLKLFIDELIDLGRNPFLLLSAQPEILDRPDALLRENLHDLVDRFFTQWHRMRGLKPKEFAGFLRAYDELCWPPVQELNGAKAPTFTEFFAPQLAAAGGLALLSPYFEDYFRQLNRTIRNNADDEVETKYLVSAIRVFLLHMRSAPHSQAPTAVAAVIKDSIDQCGIIESRRRVGDAEVLFPKQRDSRKRPRLEP